MKTQFICEKCGDRFETAEAAKKCEASHGVLIEARVMPGTAYRRSDVKAQEIWAKFRNAHGEEKAAKYQFIGYASVNFDDVKKERGCDE